MSNTEKTTTPLKDQATCPHMQFAVQCDVTRLSEIDGGPITGYTADLNIICNDCKKQFEFIGVPNGWSPDKPMASADFKTLCIPIRPDTDMFATKLNYKVRPDKTDSKKLN